MADANTTMDPYAAALIAGRDGPHRWNGYGDYGRDRDCNRNPPEQDMANMALMQSIGQVDKAVAVSTAEMQASQAAQSAGIVSQLNSVASSLAARTDGVKDSLNNLGMHLAEKVSDVDKAILVNRYELSKDVTHDGDKTRSLLTAQYEATLNRELAEARAEIIELRSDNRSTRRAWDSDVTVSQTVNQSQAQAQSQAQFDRLYCLLNDAVQNIRSTNQAINFGSGTLTASPINTNTNNRAS
jgi:hypothetical protein